MLGTMRLPDSLFAVRRYLLIACLVYRGSSWVLPCSFRALSTHLCSTPFEASLYDNPYEEDGDGSSSSLQCPPDTKLVIGLNKYSHDTSICAANAETGQVLFALEKERLTRRKHDSGNVAGLVECCLDSLGLELDNIERVVVNNHHHRVFPMEANLHHMEWESGLNINGGAEDGYTDPENLLSSRPIADNDDSVVAPQYHELSHHLAHAYSTATQAPFEEGLVVVMDGMGETFRTMWRAHECNDPTYTSDLSFGLDSFTCVPSDIATRSQTSYFDWREAESVYTFTKKETTIELRPIFKRFTEENSPPVLYNHGFENMDSVGAVYSRASSHIFGDWNACGKVMGLAPWATTSWKKDDATIRAPELPNPILAGQLHVDDGLQIDRQYLQGLPHAARNDPDLFEPDGTRKKPYDFGDDRPATDAMSREKRLPVKVALEAIALAHRLQVDLETVVIEFVKHFQQLTGSTNLCLAGGVALNSVLNGRLARGLGFEQTFIPPYPGDEGIAVGCCAFGLYGNSVLEKNDTDDNVNRRSPSVWSGPLSPYLGPEPSERDIKAAIEEASPWLDVETIRNEDQRLQLMAEEVASGGVVAWYRSRSEMGPRALGHRSILADPRKKGLVRFINQHVKSRESFRPFAPSVLAEHVHNWFELRLVSGDGETRCKSNNMSPYMSITAMVHEDKRSQIPAVTHVDGSSRLQTVTKQDEPVYHKFLSKFFESTGVPMVLNTSFNTVPGEPIVESPFDAIYSFLYSMGAIEMLVMGDYIIKRKQPDLKRLLGEASKDGSVIKIEPVCPKRAGPATFQSSFELDQDSEKHYDDIAEDTVVPEVATKVRMPDRPLHLDEKNDWFNLMDELEGELLSVCDGSVTLNDIMAQYTAVDDTEEEDGGGTGRLASKEGMEETQNLLQNIVHRLVRLYEHTFIYW